MAQLPKSEFYDTTKILSCKSSFQLTPKETHSHLPQMLCTGKRKYVDFSGNFILVLWL